MNPSWATKSLILFGFALLSFILLTASESALLGMPEAAERLLSALLLILSGTFGTALGVLSLRHKESRLGMAIAGIILNAPFAILHVFVLLFGG